MINVPLVPVKENLEGQFVTIFLSKFPDYKQNWRCRNCGWLVFQYEAGVGLIMDGGVAPEGKRFTETRCQRCKLTHRVIM